ncbi:hypothetical protein D3C86_1894570 [compost metagenome]
MTIHIELNLIDDPEILLSPEESYFRANLLTCVQKCLSLNTDRRSCAGEINMISGCDNRLNIAVHFGDILLDLKQETI